MKISVNTAIEVVVGFEKTSGNSPRMASGDRHHQDAYEAGRADRGRHCARTAAVPNRPLGRNESTTISDT